MSRRIIFQARIRPCCTSTAMRLQGGIELCPRRSSIAKPADSLPSIFAAGMRDRCQYNKIKRCYRLRREAPADALTHSSDAGGGQRPSNGDAQGAQAFRAMCFASGRMSSSAWPLQRGGRRQARCLSLSIHPQGWPPPATNAVRLSPLPRCIRWR